MALCGSAVMVISDETDSEEEVSQPMDIVQVIADDTDMEEQHQSVCHPFKSHFAEIYSPAQVARFIQHFGLSCSGSFDIVNGFDFCS